MRTQFLSAAGPNYIYFPGGGSTTSLTESQARCRDVVQAAGERVVMHTPLGGADFWDRRLAQPPKFSEMTAEQFDRPRLDRLTSTLRLPSMGRDCDDKRFGEVSEELARRVGGLLLHKFNNEPGFVWIGESGAGPGSGFTFQSEEVARSALMVGFADRMIDDMLMQKGRTAIFGWFSLAMIATAITFGFVDSFSLVTDGLLIGVPSATTALFWNRSKSTHRALHGLDPNRLDHLFGEYIRSQVIGFSPDHWLKPPHDAELRNTIQTVLQTHPSLRRSRE